MTMAPSTKEEPGSDRFPDVLRRETLGGIRDCKKGNSENVLNEGHKVNSTAWYPRDTFPYMESREA